MKSKIIVAIAAGSLLALAGTAAAYHDGGVANCEGCHTMHNSKHGAPMAQGGETGTPPATSSGNGYLLQGPDQSSTCLNCHGRQGATGGGSYQVYTRGDLTGVAPANYGPGGDFGWLKKTFTWSAHGSTRTESGDTHGHNVVAANFGLASDQRAAAPGSAYTTSPGGSFPVGQLGCHSCHDPHGKSRYLSSDGSLDRNDTLGVASEPIAESGSYGAIAGTDTPVGTAVGVYRLLASEGYSTTGVDFAGVEPPVAVAPKSYNLTNPGSTSWWGANGVDAYKVKVAYGDGMSDWCLTCHGQIATGAGGTHHQVNVALASAIRNNYNAYVKSGDLSGNVTTGDGAYSTLVPFEYGTTDRTILAAQATDDITTAGGTVDDGPLAGAKIMCLSCHRAHASGFESMTRWPNLDAMFVVDGAFDTEHGRNTAEMSAALYNTPVGHFATYQRSLCNKCHAMD